jgi:hypothetical protein
MPEIAVVVCTTSRGASEVSFEHLALTHILIPSLVATASFSQFHYTLYVGVDSDENFYTRESTKTELQRKAVNIRVHVRDYPVLRRSRIPFNEILKFAAEDGADYFVRVNDDTEFLTKEWTEIGVKALSLFEPPNVGVVGPTVQGPKNVKRSILTHDMVHKTHMEIFQNQYYSPAFDNQWVDDWITFVYGDRMQILPEWTVLHHTKHHGTRYKRAAEQGVLLKDEILRGTSILQNWLAKARSRST